MTSSGKICFMFDIDGTLLTIGHRGRNAFVGAINKICHTDAAPLNLQMAGRTDLSIIKEALERLNIEETPEIREKIFAKYKELLAISLNEPNSITLFDGAREILESLQKAGAIITLGTGNIQAGARLKMELTGLWNYFLTGGYGDDHLLRNKVLETGFQRAKNLINPHIIRELWVIGDTPLDIEAGKAINAKTCAIANGRYSVNELNDCHPDLVFPNLPAALNPLLNLLKDNL